MTNQMFVQFALSTAMILLIVTIHGLGLAMLSRVVRGETQQEHAHHIPPMSLRGMGFTLGVVLGLFALHGTEIWLFALLFLGVGALPTLESALYFSSITYGTIGYSDSEIALRWRLVAAFEGIAGVILLGWSTAFFVRLLGRIGAR